MKRIALWAFIFTLACSVPSAADFYASIMYRCTDPGGKIYMSAHSGSTDGYDNEVAMGTGWLSVNMAFYKENGVRGWNAQTGFYLTDKLPAIVPGVPTIDDFYLWGQPGSPVQDLTLFTDASLRPLAAPGVTYKLWLLSVPNGVAYSGPVQWGIDHGTITLPYYANNDGLTGYHFRMEFTAVPEPSSLLALGAGLAGMMGLWRRRIANGR